MRWIKVTALLQRGAEVEMLINSDHIIKMYEVGEGTRLYLNDPGTAEPKSQNPILVKQKLDWLEKKLAETKEAR
jgi:hypothetical protein